MAEENEIDPWMLLTEKERNALAEKMFLQEGETPHQAFNRMVIVPDNHNATIENIIAVKNITDVLGGHKKNNVWEEIESVAYVYHTSNHLVQIFVKDRERFVAALQAEQDDEGRLKFAVNDFWDKKLANHPNDSIRQRTEFSTDYPIHLANDDSSNVRAYFVHFDPASPYFRTTTRESSEMTLMDAMPMRVEVLSEIKWASAQHEKVAIWPSLVREHLKNTGQVSE